MAQAPKVEKFFITASTRISIKQLLEEHLPQRYDAETVITHGGAWMNRKRIFDPSFMLSAQETVKVHTSEFQGKTYTLDPAHIIFENPDLMVVYKPFDLNVHAVPSSFYYNLMYGVNVYLEQQGVKFEANPVTRLDRPVAGLVIFPKNKSSERRLFDLVQKRKIHKWYMAILEKRDSIGKNENNDDQPMVKYRRIQDKISNVGAKTYHDANGKFSDTLFVKIEEKEKVDIYSVYIFTGRRHQIRFHASSYLSPVVGDRLYGSRVKMGPEEIALICRGYNIPYRRQNLRIRLPQSFIHQIMQKVEL